MKQEPNPDYQRGRADAAKGQFDPPARGPLGGVFDSKSDWDRTSERRESYREGYYDKQRELKGK